MKVRRRGFLALFGAAVPAAAHAKIAEHVADNRRQVKNRYYGDFAKILSLFEREFGEQNIKFQIFELSEKLGIAYTINNDSEDRKRIAYLFKYDATLADADKAINHLREWIKNPVCPPGVAGRDYLVGNEIDVELI